MITGEQFWAWVFSHIPHILVGLSVIIQIVPIKLNPWTAILKWIGNKLNKDISDKLNKTVDTVERLEKSQDENEKDRIRWEVLDFANSCRNNIKHTKDEFQHIIELNDKYKRLLKKTDDKNGVFDAEYNYIKKLYTECQEKNNFL